MKFSLFFTIAFAFSLLLLTSACNKQFSPDEISPNGPVFTQTGNDPGCDEIGNEYNFAADWAVHGEPEASELPPNMDFYVFIGATPGYQISQECVCNVKQYELTFDFLPDLTLNPTAIEITQVDGTPIPFTFAGSSIFINQDDLEVDLHAGFAPSVNPLPNLLEAGGWCIVDNISGPGRPGEVLFEAYTELGVSPRTNLPITNIFIPVTFTTSPH